MQSTARASARLPNAILLVAGVMTFIVMGAGQSLYGPALPALARTYAMGVAEVGVLISAHWVGCAVGVGALFVASHRFAPRDCALLMMVGAGLIGTAFAWWSTLLGGFVFGIGYGFATVMFNRRFLTGFGARGPAMVSLVNALFGIGAIGAPLMFVHLGSNVGLSYALIAGFAVVTAALAFLVRGRDQGVAQAAARPYTIHAGILTLGVCAIGTEACLIGLGPVALIALGKTEVQAAELLSAFFAAFLGIRLALALAAHLIAPLTLLIAALLIATLGCGVALTVSPSAGFILLGVCAGLFFPPYFVCATALMGNDPRVTPTIIAAGLLGGIASPLVFGVVMAAFGDQVLFGMLGGLTFLAALGAMLFRARLQAVPV